MADLVLNWGLFGSYGTVMGASQTVDTGGVDVTVDFTAQDEEAQAFTYNADGYAAPGEPFSQNSFLKLFGEGGEGGIDETSTTTLSFAASDDAFSDNVQDVSFRINDIDVGRNEPGAESPNHIDFVTITAYNAAGEEVPVTVTLGSDVEAYGSNGAQAGDEAWLPTHEQGSALVNIDGPVSRILIEYANGEDGAQLVTVSDVHFSTVPAQEPAALDDSAETDYETPVVIDVLGNDTDPQNDPLTVAAVSDGANGTVTIDPATGNPVYTPNDGFEGTDTFTYTVNDPDGNADTATVTVMVGPNTVDAVDDTAETAYETPVEVAVLGNDTDPQDHSFSVTGVTDGTNGSVVIDPTSGNPVYTPDAGFEGSDSFTYTITDEDGATDTATVSVTVAEAQNDYIVEGTPGDDLIDFDYTGDPEGDMIDHNDNDPTRPPQQDTVQAGEGDDTVLAGEGDDDVYGGEGDDSIFGEEGDDTLRGEDGNDTVDGGIGDDAIDTSGSAPAIDVPTFPGVPVDADPENDRDSVIGGEGNDTIITGDDRDTIDGGAGNDVINPGIDDDVVDAGAGDDLINDLQGADLIDGGEGDDTIIAGIDTFSDYVGDDPNLPIGTILSDPNTTDGMDTVYGGAGDDVIETGDDADLIDGGTGADTIDGGIDDDTITGGDGDDVITGGHGSDSILGGEGDDLINSGDSDLLWGQDPDEIDEVPINGMDFVDGGAGNDTITGEDDDDTLLGGTGDDLLDGGLDDDSLEGGEGADTLMGGHGSDVGLGGAGDDVIDLSNDLGAPFGEEDDATDPYPGNDRDLAEGGEGNDSITTGDDDDTIFGGAGDDVIDAGIDNDLVDAGAGDDLVTAGDGDDTVTGGAGDDTIAGGEGDDVIEGGIGNDDIVGGAGDDTLSGGDDRDTFTNVNAGDVIDGGSGPVDDGPQDFDTLDLTGSAPPGGSLNVTYTSPDQQDGFVEYFDAEGNAAGTLTFTEIENVVPCFTPGTAIATPKGERMVEELREGDKIITRDNGIQEIRWVGTRTLTGHELARAPQLRPILIQKGALGNNLPEHDMLVSPQHRLLLSGNAAQLYFEEREVLAAAKHLTELPGVDEVGTLGVTYVHFMFDRHEVVLSNGAWTESFQPGANVLDGLGEAQRGEIFALFPELQTVDGVKNYSAARRSLKKHEARLLAL